MQVNLHNNNTTVLGSLMGQERSAAAVVLTVWHFKPLLFCESLTYAHICEHT